MKKTKFDALMCCFKDLSIEFQEIDDSRIQDILKSWESSFNQIDAFLSAGKVTKSKIVLGLQQGLREIPEILSDLPEAQRELGMEKYGRIVEKHFPSDGQA